MDDLEIIRRTRSWVEEFIIFNNICPFASASYYDSKIIWDVLHISESFEDVLLASISKFRNQEWNNYETMFMIMPFLVVFDDLVEIFYILQEIAIEMGYNEDLSFVAFHPESRFGKNKDKDAVNFANRSPFPMVQIIKRETLKDINLSSEQKEEILDHNASLLETIGYNKLLKKLNEYRK